MVDAPLFSAMFSMTGMVYAVMVPLTLMFILVLLCIPSLARPGATPRGVIRAIECLLLQAIGILLMTAGALPTVISVFAGMSLLPSTYSVLLLLFAGGGALFLSQEKMLHSVDEASRAVPLGIFLSVFRLIGVLTMTLWMLSFFITVLTGVPEGDTGWWIMPVIMMLYGGLFIWCTRPGSAARSLFVSPPMMRTASAARMSPVMSKKAVTMRFGKPIKKR